MDPNPPTNKVPHNKSENARLAEDQDQRTWTNFTLKLLVEVVVRLNEKDVTEESLRAVRSRHWLKVKLLKATEKHHTGLRMSGNLRDKQDMYYKVDPKVAKKLTIAELRQWKENVPPPDELAEIVKNKTGRYYAL